jgi:hypothetical protein
MLSVSGDLCARHNSGNRHQSVDVDRPFWPFLKSRPSIFIEETNDERPLEHFFEACGIAVGGAPLEIVLTSIRHRRVRGRRIERTRRGLTTALL